LTERSENVDVFPVDKMEDYRGCCGGFKGIFGTLEPKGKTRLRPRPSLYPSWRALGTQSGQAVGEKQYTKVFGKLGEDVPILGWVEILKAMTDKYAPIPVNSYELRKGSYEVVNPHRQVARVTVKIGEEEHELDVRTSTALNCLRQTSRGHS